MRIEELSPQWSRLKGLDSRPIITGLREELSYIHPSALAPEGVSPSGWDGTVSLMKTRSSDPCSLYIPTGLIDRTVAYLGSHGLEVEVSYQRPSLEGAEHGLEGLYDFQEESIQKWLASGGRAGLELPMRTGKSAYVAGGIILAVRSVIPDITTIFFCEQREVMHQAVSVLSKRLGERVGMVGGGKATYCPVTVATVQTVNQAWERKRKEYWKNGKKQYGKRTYPDYSSPTKPDLVEFISKVGLVIADEAHHSLSDSYQDPTSQMPNAWLRLGLSGTLRSNQGLDILIESIIGPTVHRIPYKDLIFHDPQVLAQPTFLVHYVQPEHLRLREHDESSPASRYAAAYDAYVVGNKARNKAIAKFAIHEAMQGKSTAILVTREEHGRILQSMIPGSTFVWGQSGGEKRDEEFDALKRKERLIFISTLIKEALDIPSLDNTVYACSGKSVIQFPQSWRCMGADGGRKPTCKILLFWDYQKNLRAHSKAQLEMLNQPGFLVRFTGEWPARDLSYVKRLLGKGK